MKWHSCAKNTIYVSITGLSTQYSTHRKAIVKKLESLRKNTSTQQIFFKQKQFLLMLQTKLTNGSFVRQGKTFTNSELIKSYLILEAREKCPKKINRFRTINYWAKTVTQS